MLVQELVDAVIVVKHWPKQETSCIPVSQIVVFFAEQFGYQTDHKLDPECVGAYLFSFNADLKTKVIVENLPVLENGFEIKTIDEAINRLNDVSEELFYALKSTEDE